MAKLAKPLFGAPNGEIYPRWIEAGEECPPELEAAAREIGALEVVQAIKAARKAPETK